MPELALVTGATSGIGKEVCELFALKGLDLIISGRDERRLFDLKEHLSKKVSVQVVQADLSQVDGRELMISVVQEHLPSIVINNAGLGYYGEALTYPTDQQVDILEVNGRAVLEITLEAARAMLSGGKKGIILNVSSAAAFHVFPLMAVYAASKAFVNQFSQAFDYEFKRHGIRVLTLCPGSVATEFQKKAGETRNTQQLGRLSASFVANQIWKQIERLDPLLIIDWKYRALTLLSKVLPISWIAAAEKRIIAARIKPRTLVKVKK